jgi:hypothetical protein
VEHDAPGSVRSGVPLVGPLDPAFDLRVFVGGVVVDDHVQGQAFGDLAVGLLEVGEPFGVRVALCCAADDPAVEIVERGEERQRAVPDVKQASLILRVWVARSPVLLVSVCSVVFISETRPKDTYGTTESLSTPEFTGYF